MIFAEISNIFVHRNIVFLIWPITKFRFPRWPPLQDKA